MHVQQLFWHDYLNSSWHWVFLYVHCHTEGRFKRLKSYIKDWILIKPWGSSITPFFHQTFADLSWIAQKNTQNYRIEKVKLFVSSPHGVKVFCFLSSRNSSSKHQEPWTETIHFFDKSHFQKTKIERQLMLQDPPFFLKNTRQTKRHCKKKHPSLLSSGISELGIQLWWRHRTGKNPTRQRHKTNQDSRKTYKTSDLKDVIGSNVSLARSLKMSKSAWPSSHVCIHDGCMYPSVNPARKKQTP